MQHSVGQVQSSFQGMGISCHDFMITLFFWFTFKFEKLFNSKSIPWLSDSGGVGGSDPTESDPVGSPTLLIVSVRSSQNLHI
jgi:hypothetical protein